MIETFQKGIQKVGMQAVLLHAGEREKIILSFQPHKERKSDKMNLRGRIGQNFWIGYIVPGDVMLQQGDMIEWNGKKYRIESIKQYFFKETPLYWRVGLTI